MLQLQGRKVYALMAEKSLEMVRRAPLSVLALNAVMPLQRRA